MPKLHEVSGAAAHAQRIEVEFTDEAVELIAREGSDPEFGARPLRRTIQRRVENELSRLVLGGGVEPDNKVVVDADVAQLSFDVQKIEERAPAPA